VRRRIAPCARLERDLPRAGVALREAVLQDELRRPHGDDLRRTAEARRIGRVGSRVELVAIAPAVAVAVDPDPNAGARRNAGPGLLVPRVLREEPERVLPDRAVARAVGEEGVPPGVDRSAQSSVEHALD